MGIRLGVVLAVPLMLAGCGDASRSSDAAARSVPLLDGTSWIATKIIEAGRPRALVPGTELRVAFADGSISVNAGCNGMGASYRLSAESELSVRALAGTEMACDPPRMDQDAWLSGTVFAEPLVVSVVADTLTLAREGLEIVLTDRNVTSPDALLEGTTWRLDGIRSGDSVSSVPSGGRTPTLTISTAGSVTVDTGCNRGTGSARVTDSAITFGPVATTRMACADAAGRRTEAAVLAVLDGAVSWSIAEETLTLTRGDRGLTYRSGS